LRIKLFSAFAFLCILLIPAYSAQADTDTVTWTKIKSERFDKLYYLNNQYLILGASGEPGDKGFTIF